MDLSGVVFPGAPSSNGAAKRFVKLGKLSNWPRKMLLANTQTPQFVDTEAVIRRFVGSEEVSRPSGPRRTHVSTRKMPPHRLPLSQKPTQKVLYSVRLLLAQVPLTPRSPFSVPVLPTHVFATNLSCGPVGQETPSQCTAGRIACLWGWPAPIGPDPAALSELHRAQSEETGPPCPPPQSSPKGSTASAHKNSVRRDRNL